MNVQLCIKNETRRRILNFFFGWLICLLKFFSCLKSEMKNCYKFLFRYYFFFIKTDLLKIVENEQSKKNWNVINLVYIVREMILSFISYPSSMKIFLEKTDFFNKFLEQLFFLNIKARILKEISVFLMINSRNFCCFVMSHVA